MSQNDHQPQEKVTSSDGLIARHPRLGLLIIAGVFYITVTGMCLIVLVLIIRSQNG